MNAERLLLRNPVDAMCRARDCCGITASDVWKWICSAQQTRRYNSPFVWRALSVLCARPCRSLRRRSPKSGDITRCVNDVDSLGFPQVCVDKLNVFTTPFIFDKTME